MTNEATNIIQLLPHIKKEPEQDSFTTNIEISCSACEQLSSREREIARILIAGKSAKQIADVLNLSQRTVEHYINNIKIKFSCRKQSELIARLLN